MSRLQNNFTELWSLLNSIVLDIFTDPDALQEWFSLLCMSEQLEKMSQFVSTMHTILRPFLLRCIKANVLGSALPPKKNYVGTTISGLWWKLTLQKLTAREADLLNASGNILLDHLLRELLRREHKLLLFNHLTTMLDILEAGCLGMNLTAADTVIFDQDWVQFKDGHPSSQDRAHRTGQTKPVLIFRLVTAPAVEEKIMQRAGEKRKLEALAWAVELETHKYHLFPHHPRLVPRLQSRSDRLILDTDGRFLLPFVDYSI
uniref:SNF2-family ATP dependent chromatin remodeling factor n=1 Tax=Mycena chlorophos TaxID=658473 RepID=A0ABQ0LC61_MYCCL|nr:SNF2-family ATP dependent chromatin remodeling factor [Mycena chlorophos]